MTTIGQTAAPLIQEKLSEGMGATKEYFDDCPKIRGFLEGVSAKLESICLPNDPTRDINTLGAYIDIGTAVALTTSVPVMVYTAAEYGGSHLAAITSVAMLALCLTSLPSHLEAMKDTYLKTELT